MRSHPYSLRAICQAALVSIVATMIGAAVTTSNMVKGADLNPAHVPMDAKWLLHIDQEGMADLETTEELRELYPQIAKGLRAWLRGRYGIDPQDGLRSLTMFSRDYQPHTGTVLLQTQYDDKKIRSLLHDYESLKKTAWKGHTLYTITLAKHHDKHRHDSATHAEHDKDGGKQMTVFLGDELIVLASSIPNAKSVLRLLDGDANSLKGMKSPLLSQAPEGAVIYGAAIELGRLDQYPVLLPLLQQQEQCVYAFGHRAGKLFETLTLTAETEGVADKTSEVLEGLVAYEKLCAAGSEPLTELMRNVRLSHKGTELTVRWEGKSQLVVQAFGDLKARTDQWMKRLAEPSENNGTKKRQENE